MINSKVLVVALLFSVLMLHAGSVRKKDDPILNTQTNPIALKDKMEEIKDGEKGAPSPSFKHYPKSRFLTEPSIEDYPNSESEAPEESLAEGEEPLIEDLGEYEDAEEPEEEDWWEEEEDEGEGPDENSFKETDGKDVAEEAGKDSKS